MTARFTVSLPEQDLARIDDLAKERSMSRSELVREATEEYIADAGAATRAKRRLQAGEEMLRHLEELRALPVDDDRPVLDILREMRGPLEPRQPWTDGDDMP